ncbi:hypothetical protein LSAT2_032260, partial [Lamellibrachia satsuma]
DTPQLLWRHPHNCVVKVRTPHNCVVKESETSPQLCCEGVSDTGEGRGEAPGGPPQLCCEGVSDTPQLWCEGVRDIPTTVWRDLKLSDMMRMLCRRSHRHGYVAAIAQRFDKDLSLSSDCNGAELDMTEEEEDNSSERHASSDSEFEQNEVSCDQNARGDQCITMETEGTNSSPPKEDREEEHVS